MLYSLSLTLVSTQLIYPPEEIDLLALDHLLLLCNGWRMECLPQQPIASTRQYHLYSRARINHMSDS